MKALILISDSFNPSEQATVEGVSADEKTAAVWYDSDVSRRCDAVLWFEGERICVRNANGDIREGTMETVKISSRLGNIPRRIVFSDGVSLTVDDNDFIDAAIRRCRKLAALLHKIESNWRWLVTIVAAAVAVAFVFVNWGVPSLANTVAHKLPQELLVSITDSVYQKFKSSAVVKDSQLDWETSQKMKKIFAEVSAKTGGDNDYDMRLKLHRLSFSSKQADDANAFALPDGLIIASDGLVKVLSEEEFAVVMAHEIGHVRQRHGMRSFLQSIGLFTFISFAFGDPSFLLAGGVFLLNLKYSRDFEREADCFAYHRYMRLQNLPSTLLGDALLKIEQGSILPPHEVAKESGETDDGESDEQGFWENTVEVISTHPASEARANLEGLCGDERF